MTLYYRLLKMIDRHQPMTKTQLTRRGLSNLYIKMPELRKLIRKAERDNLIESIVTYKDDRATTTFTLTAAGKIWIEDFI